MMRLPVGYVVLDQLAGSRLVLLRFGGYFESAVGRGRSSLAFAKNCGGVIIKMPVTRVKARV